MRVCFLRNSLSFTIQTQFYLIFCSNPRHSNYMQIVQSIEKHLLYTRSSGPETKPFSSNNNVVAFILYAFPFQLSPLSPSPLSLSLFFFSLSLFLSIHLSSHLSIYSYTNSNYLSSLIRVKILSCWFHFPKTWVT